MKRKFTLIELLVVTALFLCGSKKSNKINTSLRPAGRTSRLTQSSSSHLHIFTQSAFTLIELLVTSAIYFRNENFKTPEVLPCPRAIPEFLREKIKFMTSKELCDLETLDEFREILLNLSK